MRSSAIVMLGILSSLASALSGCGVFGQKAAALRNLAYQSEQMGCLNGFAEKLKQYTDGTIPANEWKGSMECVSTNIELFQKFVKPSSAEGYSLEEMQVFVSRFLLTTQPVSEDLIKSAFEFKAALLGGSTEHISSVELQTFLSNLTAIKQISLDLLPELKSVHGSPSDAEWARFFAFAQASGEKLADLLPATAKASFSMASIQAIVAEARRFGVDLDPALPSAMMAAKVLLVGGSETEIEPDSWREIARLGGRFAGPVMVAMDPVGPGEKPFFERRGVFFEFLASFKAAILRSMSHHGGKWPLARIDRLVDTAPAAWIKYDRTVLRNTLRPIARKVFGSQSADAFDSAGLNTVMKLADDWSRGATHINTLFRRLGRDHAPWQELIDFARMYEQSILDPVARTDVQRLISLMQRFKPMLEQGEKELVFRDFVEYSRDQLSSLHWMNIAAKRLGQTYSASGGVLTEDDLRAFFDDFLPIAAELRLLDPTSADVSGRRFRDIDLFMQVSDGNGSISEGELTSFIMFAGSIGALSKRISDEVLPGCPAVSPDPFGTVFVPISCFEPAYFSRHAQLWDHLPLMSEFYAPLDSGRKNEVQAAMAVAGRRYGDSDQPVGGFDIQGYAGLNHYIESLFYRFDRDQNRVLDKDEVLLAFPLFKRMLVKVGNLEGKPDFIVEAVFTYIAKYQEIPKQDLKFFGWIAQKPFWKISADRLALLKLVSQLSKPEPIPPQHQD